MVCGPIFVLLCSVMIMQSVRDQFRPNLSIESSERLDFFSTDDRKRAESILSFVSVEFDDGELAGTSAPPYIPHTIPPPSTLPIPSSTLPQPIPPSSLSSTSNQLSQNLLTQEEGNSQRIESNKPLYDPSHPHPSSSSSSSSKWMKWLGIYYLQKLYLSLRAYRRITFLIVASLISIGSALVIANTAWKIDQYTEQTSFYNCMLRINAYEEVGDTDNCGGQAKRLRVSWSIFTVEIFLVSFGIGPYLAFGTESVRAAIKRISLWLWNYIRQCCCSSPCLGGDGSNGTAYERYQLWLNGQEQGRGTGRGRENSTSTIPNISPNEQDQQERYSISESSTGTGYSRSQPSVVNVTKSMITNPSNVKSRDRTASYRSSETDESSIVITPFYEGGGDLDTSNSGRKSFGVQKRSYLSERPSNE